MTFTSSLPKIPVLTPAQLEGLKPADRKEYLERAQRVAQMQRTNPLAFWEPYGHKQHDFLASRAWIKAFFGGNGSGKSAVGTVDDLIQLCDASVLPPHLRQYKRWQPPFYLRVVAPKMGVIESTVLEKFRELVPRDQLRGGSFDRAFSKEMRKLHFSNGSWALFNTSDQDRDAHAGVELHRVRFDEEPEWEIYLENVARLRSFAPEAQLSFTMTPSLKGSLGWTYDEIYERRDDPGVFVTTANMFDNPFIDKESMMAALSGASEAERAAMINGEFIAFHGRVLNGFELGTHVVEPPKIEQVQQLQVWIGIDPGVRRAGVVWCGFDKDNHMLVFDELYPESQTVAQIAAQIREKNAFWKIKRPLFVIDPSFKNRSLSNAESVEGSFMREGIFPTPGQHDRLAGVLQMRQRIEEKALMVSRHCKNWLKEADRWVVHDDEVSSESKPSRAKGAGGTFATMGPDHLMDPTRYVCMERLYFQRPKPSEPAWGGLQSGTAPSLAQLKKHLHREPAVGPMGRFS